jgi:tetratricopeptide (TPR) repeat protein
MTKASKGRQARAEVGRQVEAAKRLLANGKAGEALKLLAAADRLQPKDPEILAELGFALLITGRLLQAVEVLRRSIAIHPEVAETHFRLGLALESAADYEAAIIAYREATELSPTHAGAWGRLADLLYRKSRRDEAAVAYDRAAALAPGSTQARLQRAMALFVRERLREAEEELRALLAIDSANVSALSLLGSLLQISGRLDDAGDTFRSIIDIAPATASAYQGVVGAKRFTEADRPWIARILAQLEDPAWQRRLVPVDQARHAMTLHFALGKIHDDLGEYAEAMKHVTAANEVRRRLGPFDLAGNEKKVTSLISRYTSDFLENKRTLGCDDRTPIVIVGMPRSGTSLLERVLSSHPNVRGCGEVDLWRDRGGRLVEKDPRAIAEVAGSLQRDYLALLHKGDDQDDPALRATDKMPFNFYLVGLVHLLFPNATIVHCERNPVDTCLSIYMTDFASVWDFASGLGDLAAYYRLYKRLVDHWRSVLPADRWIDVRYEDVVTDPATTACKLVEFCGLPWDPACLHPERNRQAVVTASSWQARQPIYRGSVERWRRYEPWVGELLTLLPATAT